MRIYRVIIPILLVLVLTACSADSAPVSRAQGAAPAATVPSDAASPEVTATEAPASQASVSGATAVPALPTRTAPSATAAEAAKPESTPTVTSAQPEPTSADAGGGSTANEAAAKDNTTTATAVATAAVATAAPATAVPAADAAQAPTEPVQPTLDPARWSELPVIPALSPRALEILADGLARGNNPRAFSKIGDCESQAEWFLNDFDLGPDYYALGEYEAELGPVIEYYAGSFERNSLAAKPGFTAASLMAPIWSDRALCEKNETPLACELRIHRPLVAFILVGTNDASNPKTFEGHMRKAIEYTISQGVLPILGTKADNVEGDHFINQTMARLADEYRIPLWNYWAAVQDLPGNGLQEDGVHLTFASPRFDNPENLKRAWPVRNLNALQMLKEVKTETD